MSDHKNIYILNNPGFCKDGYVIMAIKQKEQKDYRKLYEDIAQSEWFKKSYVGKSLGEEQKPAEWSDTDNIGCSPN